VIAADLEDAAARVVEATAGAGVDVAAVTVGEAGVVGETFGLLATGGRLNVFAGVAGGGRVEVDPNALHYRGLRLLGTTGASLPTLRRTIGLLAGGRVTLDGLVSATFALADAADAFAAAARSATATGVDPDPERHAAYEGAVDAYAELLRVASDLGRSRAARAGSP
jgi:L-iditol 2-dehydrogenase